MKLTDAAQEGVMRFLGETRAEGVSKLDDWEDPVGRHAAWAWVAFLLRAAQDEPKWFPKGKWATIQEIERQLIDDAKSRVAGRSGR
jgi:hypothetical protein